MTAWLAMFIIENKMSYQEKKRTCGQRKAPFYKAVIGQPYNSVKISISRNSKINSVFTMHYICLIKSISVYKFVVYFEHVVRVLWERTKARTKEQKLENIV